ncbi:isocitrate lyase/PEP mutase family protein [Aminiphilus circumscriptus]|uniref:isocitrate lyase/PEP mutase family protein n=1 Tax=Aminiphilus circumscriptus TaxID=290732 RepID=UPI00047867CE|nr:oxaloacetate decarboxylase [Aminiphilus circumscriptus]
MRKTTLFRTLVEGPEILVLPGAHDSLTARVIEKCGFKALTAGGYSFSASLLGKPDIGLLTMTEMVHQYRNLVNAVDIPVFADADTGYGDVHNVMRAVRKYEAAGVAGLFIEDQVFPKRCGHMAGKAVIPLEEMVAEIKAAIAARQDPDLVITARTNALAVHGFDDAIRRGKAYAEAGADMIFVEAVTSEEQMRTVNREILKPTLANMIEGGKTPLKTPQELQNLGYAVVVHPCSLTYAVAGAAMRCMTELATHGTTAGCREDMMDFDEFFRFIGAPEIREREKRFF